MRADHVAGLQPIPARPWPPTTGAARAAQAATREARRLLLEPLSWQVPGPWSGSAGGRNREATPPSSELRPRLAFGPGQQFRPTRQLTDLRPASSGLERPGVTQILSGQHLAAQDEGKCSSEWDKRLCKGREQGPVGGLGLGHRSCGD